MSGPKFPPVRREHTGDPQADRMQSARDDLAKILQRCPFLFGRAIRVQLMAFTNKVVKHKLGVPAACIVIRRSTSVAALYEVPTDPHDDDNQLVLGADVDSTWDLWFYPRINLIVDPATGQSP